MPSYRQAPFAAVAVALTLLIGMTLLVAAAAPASAGTLFGFNEDWGTPGHEIEASSPFHPTVQRLHLNWSLIEKSPGAYWWESSDAIYRGMVAQGAPPIAMVFAPPCWAAANSPCPADDYAPKVYPVDRAHYGDWERFVRAVVRRYPKLAALEVWNEPNYGTYYNPQPDVTSYVETLMHAHRASKAVRPALPVLGGSLAPITTRRRARRDGGFPRNPPGKVPYVFFLDRMYALGAGRYMDALALHPYPNFAPYVGGRAVSSGVRPRFARGIRLDVKRQIAMVRRVARKHGLRKPIWVTETGVCTTGPRERKVSPQEQAVALKQIYVSLERLGVKAILTHRLWDVRVPGTPEDNIENGCGLASVSGRHKPAWDVLQRLRASRVARPRRRTPRPAIWTKL